MKNHTFHAIGTLVVLALKAIQGFTTAAVGSSTTALLAGGLDRTLGIDCDCSALSATLSGNPRIRV